MRHAETEWNVQGLLQGHGDAPLTELGRREASEAARLLEAEGLQRIVASDLGRARDTAGIVGKRLGLEVALDRSWRELDVGPQLVGQPSAAVASLSGYERRPSWRFPGGESLDDLRARVRQALRRLDADPRATLVVTHGGPIRVLLAEAAGLKPDRVLEQVVPRAPVVRFAWHDGRVGEAVFLRG